MIGTLPHDEPAALMHADDAVGDELVTSGGVLGDVAGAPPSGRFRSIRLSTSVPGQPVASWRFPAV